MGSTGAYLERDPWRKQNGDAMAKKKLIIGFGLSMVAAMAPTPARR
jgi:hypothetical protein